MKDELAVLRELLDPMADDQERDKPRRLRQPTLDEGIEPIGPNVQNSSTTHVAEDTALPVRERA